MKILKGSALLLLVSCGAVLAFAKCAQMNLEALSQSIPKTNMFGLEKNDEHLVAYRDCLNRQQDLATTVYTKNKNEIIARRSAHAEELKQALRAQEALLMHAKQDVLNAHQR